MKRNTANRGTTMIRSTIALTGILACAAAYAQGPVTLSLDDVHRILAERSPALLAADRAIEAADAAAREARARRWPTVSVSAGYNRLSEVPAPSVTAGPLGTIQLGETVTNTYSAQASVSYPIFTGFRLENVEQAALQAKAAAGYDRTTTLAARLESADEAYWRLHVARSAYRTATESVALVEAFLADVRRLREAGMATYNDELEVGVRLSEARLAVIQAQHAAELAQAALANQLSMPLTTQIALADSPAVDGAAIEPLESLLGQARENRPELRALQARLAAAERQVDAEKGARLPSVMVSGSYLLANPNQRYFPTEQKWHDTWAVGLGVSWTAWDWGVTRRRTDRALAQADQVTETMRQVAQGVEMEVMQSRLTAVEAGRRITVAEESIRQAEEHFRILQVAFRAGSSSSTEVLDAETRLSRARMSLVQARVDQRIALARLQRAIGANTPEQGPQS